MKIRKLKVLINQLPANKIDACKGKRKKFIELELSIGKRAVDRIVVVVDFLSLFPDAKTMQTDISMYDISKLYAIDTCERKTKTHSNCLQ